VYWPILVIGASAIAGVAAVWPRPAQLSVVSAGSTGQAAPARSMGRLLVRQSVVVVVLAALLAGLMPTVREALILIAGLIVAGPVLTMALPHVPVPSAVARVPRAARWVAAMVIALAVSWVIMKLAGDALYKDYFVLVLTLAVVAPLFRLLLEAGIGPPRVGRAPGSRPGPPTPAGISTILLLALGLWLAFPSVAWAHDCPGELEECLRKAAWAAGAMLGAALAAVAGAMGWSSDGGEWTLWVPIPGTEVSLGLTPSPAAPPASEPSASEPREAPPPPETKPRPPGVHGPPQ
jgi:hypothetical protein